MDALQATVPEWNDTFCLQLMGFRVYLPFTLRIIGRDVETGVPIRFYFCHANVQLGKAKLGFIGSTFSQLSYCLLQVTELAGW